MLHYPVVLHYPVASLAVNKDDFGGRQDDVEDKLEAKDGIIAGLRERVKALTSGVRNTELEKKFADQAHHMIILAEQAVRHMEMLESLRRENEKLRKERDNVKGESEKAEEAMKKSEERWKWAHRWRLESKSSRRR